MATAACVLMLGTAGMAVAASGGDPNAGDVWTDNVGQPSGPGHEQDPHLSCSDINLWGAGLADSSGTYTIDGWPPSGSQEVDYSSNWSYDTSKGGTQVVSVINVQQLVTTAINNGDRPVNKNGYHFKLDFSQDPQKHKTFWVDCPAPSSSSSSSGSSGSTTSTSGTSGSSGTGTCTCSSTTESGGQTMVSSQPTSGQSVSGQTLAKHHKKHKKHKKLVKPRRKHHAPRRSVQAVSTARPAFTG